VLSSVIFWGYNPYPKENSTPRYSLYSIYNTSLVKFSKHNNTSIEHIPWTWETPNADKINTASLYSPTRWVPLRLFRHAFNKWLFFAVRAVVWTDRHTTSQPGSDPNQPRITWPENTTHMTAFAVPLLLLVFDVRASLLYMETYNQVCRLWGISLITCYAKCGARP
jgi:hypothetical protein